MVSECMNPDCRRKLHYLRNGRVVRVVRCDNELISVEHFWLCGNCLQKYDFRFTGEGQVSLARRRDAVMAERTPPVLTLVA